MNSLHRVFQKSSQQMKELDDHSVELVVTSPPYPMIEMWDGIFADQNNNVEAALATDNHKAAFELMHAELDTVWKEVNRVVKPGGMVCINIGDATRTINGEFRLFANHARITNSMLGLGLSNLPNIIWRKPTNAPNKFMGSGMLPAGGYVTLEHEYILIFRKGPKRAFNTDAEKLNRQQSAYFWEERNVWFSDVWELRGTSQKLPGQQARERSAAFPFELAYRLINMFSVKGDTVLDPFLGTGTTTLAAIASARNSVGFEIDDGLAAGLLGRLGPSNTALVDTLNAVITARLTAHLAFVKARLRDKGDDAFSHLNIPYHVPVVTSQERELVLNYLSQIATDGSGATVHYISEPVMDPPARMARA